jgi:hypothetical protein
MKISPKFFPTLALIPFLCLFIFYLWGCGQNTTNSGGGSGGGVTPNFTITGKIGGVSVSGLKAASALAVTHIIAIGANNDKFMTTPDANGNFSLGVVSGYPYALGFYNQTGSTITLLGYLRQDQVDWHSLPLMAPVTTSTNLGTVEIDMTSVEATPSIALNDLLSQVNMDLATANLYGSVDGVMTLFTNVDVDGNGVFDSLENKAYLLAITVGTNLGSTQGIASGEVTKMLNQFNETYYPVPNAYQLILHAVEIAGSIPANGATGTIKFPTTIYGANGLPRTYLNGAVWGSNDRFWNFMGDPATENITQCELVTPEVVPSGTYTFEVGSKAYTFKNVQGSALAAIGTTEGMIFPVFKMVTNAAGELTTIHYKWMIKEGGVVRQATAAEVQATIVDQTMNTNNATESSPSLGVTLGSYPSPSGGPYCPPKKISRDGNSIDVTGWIIATGENVKFSDIAMFQCGYSLNSNINLSFMFGK